MFVTVRDVVSAFGRRWYVLIAILLCFCGIAALLARDGGSFSTRTVVTFTLPARTTLDPESGVSDASVIAFAGAIATEINLGRPSPQYSDSSAPYYGAGVRQGVIVGLRNAGNQWRSSYPFATIEVQIVGRTYEWVQQMQHDVLEKIEEVASVQQSVLSPKDRIVVTVEPLTTNIEQIEPSRTSQFAAFGAIFFAALIAGGWGAVGLDHALMRRRAGTSRTSSHSVTQRRVKGSTA